MNDLDTDPMERRLQEWSAWIRGGRSGDGFPTISVLHRSWMPPAPGRPPTMRTSRADPAAWRHRALHVALQALSVRLINTVVVHYLMRMPVAEQAAVLECDESTVHARLREARRLLAMMLAKA